MQLFGSSAGTGGSVVASAQSFSELASAGKLGSPGVTLASGLITWLMSYKPFETSGLSVGTGGSPTVGVINSLTNLFNGSFA